jgi:hypothetical protein
MGKQFVEELVVDHFINKEEIVPEVQKWDSAQHKVIDGDWEPIRERYAKSMGTNMLNEIS